MYPSHETDNCCIEIVDTRHHEMALHPLSHNGK
jgi:hypothetical protein